MLLDPRHVAKEKGEQLSRFFDAVYQANIRLAIINPNEAGYKGFIDNMRALLAIVEKMKSTNKNISKIILDNVVNTVRKDTVANLLDIRSSYDELSADQGSRVNEKALPR